MSRFDGTGAALPDTVALDFVFAFTGREWDDDIHLANHRARWYDPQAGRFINQDPSAASPAGTALAERKRQSRCARLLAPPERHWKSDYAD